ncbi:MAG: hypothetical protein J6T12_07865, partial [Salinivirgaceae bacterium]|nr:hypothetical protein [Salinivirgaceae bacterium]
MLKIIGRIAVLLILFALPAMAQAQTADSLFVSGITDGTGRDTLINTLGVVSDSTLRDSLALADTVRADSVVSKPVRDTSRYCLYRKVFIDKDSLRIHKWRYNPNTYDFDMSTYDSSLYM